jgi:geranylgeranyl diphosphate synthase type II
MKPLMTSSPTIMTTADGSGLTDYMSRSRSLVEDAMARYMAELEENPQVGCPSRLAYAMRYSLLGGGKRLRPVLCVMAAEACGGEAEPTLPAACALEMIHTYSLIHDDLPAMDDDDLRRGRATCHKAFDEATAILAGDGLLTLAFEIIARDVRPAASAVECVRVLAESAGPSGMVGGQMADHQAEDRAQGEGTLDELELIHRRKTGALLRAPLRMGGVIAGAAESTLAALDHYGRAVGLAFQIVDDLLDVEGDETKLGKRVGKDDGHGKWTYPRFLGIEGSRVRARQLADEAIAAIQPFGVRGQWLRALALALLERDR